MEGIGLSLRKRFWDVKDLLTIFCLLCVGCVEASLSQACSLPPPNKPAIATAIFTSPYSIRTGRILHFDEVAHVSYHNKSYEGLRFSDNPKIGKDHPGAVVMVKTLKSTA